MARKKTSKKKWQGGGKWSTREKIFIIKQYHLKKSHIEVKRALRNEFGYSRKIKDTYAPNLHKVFENFEKNGPYKHHQASDMPKKKANPEVREAVVSYIEENPTSSLKAAARQLTVPQTTVILHMLIWPNICDANRKYFISYHEDLLNSDIKIW